jgi:HK97 family phage portal protein
MEIKISFSRRTKSPNYIPLQTDARIPYTPLTVSDQTYIKQGYEMNADLFSVINYCTGNAANIKPILYDVSGKEKIEVIKHDLIELMKMPVPGMTYRRWMGQALGYYMLTGNVYIWGPLLEVGVNRGRTTQLIILPSQFVTPKRVNGVMTYKVSVGTWKRTFPAEEILHIRTPQFDYGNDVEERGMSPIKTALYNLSASNNGIKSQAMRFQNNGGDGLIGFKNAITDEQIKAVQAKLDDRSGPNSAGKIFAAGSEFDYTNFGLSPADLQILQTVGWNRTVFCNIYGVDPHLIDPTVGSTYNNQREAVASPYNRTIIPFIDELFNGLNNWLVPAYKGSLQIEIDKSGVPELQKDKATNVTWLAQAWWLTGNERRREIDYEPIDEPEMDLIQYPQNLMPFGADKLTDGQLGKIGAGDYRT